MTSRIIVLALALLPWLGVPTLAFAQAGQRCFTETQQCIAGPIRSYWEHNGGLPIFGYPISPQRVEAVEDQQVPVQWFERDRLEDHGAAGVMAGRLGARQLTLTDRPWEYFDKVAAGIPANCMFFSETGHSLCEPYLSYWRANGGLARFGYPVTQPFSEVVEEQRFEAQYFERRRMERHPELPGSPILLGLLGRETIDRPDPISPYPECLKQAPPSLLPAIQQLHLGAPIGCPSGAAWQSIPASTQSFERGLMLWVGERRMPMFGYPATIFALVEPGPTLGAYESDSWVAGQDPEAAAATPPRADLFAPWRGFGKIWMAQPALRSAIGWATEPQAQAHTVDTQVFRTAMLLRVNETGQVYAFGNASNRQAIQIVTP